MENAMSHPHHPGPAYHSYAPPPPKRSGGCLYALLIGAALFAGLVVVIALLASLGDSGGSAGRDTSAVAEDATGRKPAGDGGAKTEEKPAKPRTPGIGTVVRDGEFSFKVTKVEQGVSEIGEGFLASKPQGRYVLVHLTVRNIGDEAQGFSSFNQKLIDTRNREFDADSSAAALSLEESNSLFEHINPGNTVKGIVVFDVPKNFRPKAIELHDSAFSSGVTVALS
jgi:hypothetical protein